MNTVKSAISINWFALGGHLMCLSDEEQADFFNGMMSELAGPEYLSHISREQQMLSIGERITHRTREWCKQYMPCLWVEED